MVFPESRIGFLHCASTESLSIEREGECTSSRAEHHVVSALRCAAIACHINRRSVGEGDEDQARRGRWKEEATS
jgi:hypothetical protein